MHRTQVMLTEKQIRQLREEAARHGVSIAALIRDAVDAHLARQRARRKRALDAVGRFASGRHDVAEAHDRELDEAYDA